MNSIDRRDFLKGAAAMAFLLSAKDLLAADAPVAGPPVKIGVVGCGDWGREALISLSRLKSAEISAICDTYEPFVNRCKEIAPNAVTFDDFRKLLESDVEAVVVATPSHQHKDIALAAIQAGKHVYCEAPLANTVEDAKAIALAGKGSSKVFQAGLQGRSNLLHNHMGKFARSGCLGTPAQVFAQWHKRDSWRRPAPTADREKERNWRLSKETSGGLMAEAGIHQLDLAGWYLNGLPTAVTAFGGILEWKDGRDVLDTVQCVFEFPNNVRMVFISTLANSFSNAYTLFQGNESSLLVRENRGWMIKEADSRMLGWEGYAHKEPCFDETGICMLADATKLDREEQPEDGSVSPTKEALYCALENFTKSIREDMKPACGALEGYQATVMALKANEAALGNTKINFQTEWFDI